MTTIDYYERLLRYEAWANRETVGSLRQPGAPAKAIRWMAHIVGAGSLWLARLREEPPALAVWPDLGVDECAVAVEVLSESWRRYVDQLTLSDLEEGVGYRNSQGQYWTSTVADILTHVSLHASYHRGQIATSVRESGGTPAYTDFIHATRQRLVE